MQASLGILWFGGSYQLKVAFCEGTNQGKSRPTVHSSFLKDQNKCKEQGKRLMYGP